MSGSAFLRSNASPLCVWSPVLTTWEGGKTVTSFSLAARKVHSDRGIGIAKLCSREPGWRKPQFGSHQFPEDEWRCGTDFAIDIDNPIKASWGLSVHDGRLNERQLKTKRWFWTSITAWMSESIFKESCFMMRWSSFTLSLVFCRKRIEVLTVTTSQCGNTHYYHYSLSTCILQTSRMKVKVRPVSHPLCLSSHFSQYLESVEYL